MAKKVISGDKSLPMTECNHRWPVNGKSRALLADY